MRILFILLTCLACADAFAQARGRSDGPPSRDDDLRRTEQGRPGRSVDDLRERRESLRAFRDEMRQQQVQQREDDRPSRPDRSYRGNPAEMRRGSDDDAKQNLRRLSPEDRRRLRQEMRDAFRR